MSTDDQSAPYNAGVPNSSPGVRSESQPLPALAGRLGYLLKHAQLRLAELTSAAMAPFGITGRECAVLIVIDSHAPLSQQEVAVRLGVDRTTMVLLIDDLEGKGLVRLRRASLAGQDAERRFLSALSDEEAAELREALGAIAFPGGAADAGGARAGAS